MLVFGFLVMISFFHNLLQKGEAEWHSKTVKVQIRREFQCKDCISMAKVERESSTVWTNCQLDKKKNL